MRKVVLSLNEQLKYEAIKELYYNGGNKRRVALKLGISYRHVNRLINKFKDMGKSGFVHGNKGKVSNRKVDDETKANIINLYLKKYDGCSIAHFTELLSEHENIFLSNVCVRNILLDNHILSPRASKTTKKKLKKKLHQLKEKSASMKLKNDILDKIDRIDHNPHAKRQKSKYFGELIQMDASSFDFLKNGEKIHLHIAVDDSTNTVLGAYFDYYETLNGYYNVLHQIIKNYGIPLSFYTDRRTIFEYKKTNSNSLEKDTFTQFSYACHQLGTEIKTTSVPQAKGLVEKVNDTFQLRLPIELEIAGIKTIDEANEFLKTYLIKYNNKFAHRVNDSKSCFQKQDDMKKIDFILAVIDKRIIQNDHSIKYKNKSYFLVDENSEKIFLKRKTEVLVIKSFSKNLYASIDDKVYCLEEIPTHKQVSKDLDIHIKTPEKKVKKKHIPPMNHPWRLSYFNKFLSDSKL